MYLDITNDFYYHEVKDGISIDYLPNKTILETDTANNLSNEEATLSVRRNKEDQEFKKRHINKNLKFSDIAHKLDKMNSDNFKESRMAIHNHSRFATAKLASMVIGRVVSREFEENSEESPNYYTTYLPSMSYAELDGSMYKRYILVNTETVTGERAERPVKKLTFQPTNSNGQLPKFSPGDYVEVMCHINGQVVIRPYTPLQGTSTRSFSILVKIYEMGLMSQHLVSKERKINSIIMVLINSKFTN